MYINTVSTFVALDGDGKVVGTTNVVVVVVVGTTVVVGNTVDVGTTVVDSLWPNAKGKV